MTEMIRQHSFEEIIEADIIMQESELDHASMPHVFPTLLESTSQTNASGNTTAATATTAAVTARTGEEEEYTYIGYDGEPIYVEQKLSALSLVPSLLERDKSAAAVAEADLTVAADPSWGMQSIANRPVEKTHTGRAGKKQRKRRNQKQKVLFEF
jgi:hypothetical protein